MIFDILPFRPPEGKTLRGHHEDVPLILTFIRIVRAMLQDEEERREMTLDDASPRHRGVELPEDLSSAADFDAARSHVVSLSS